MKGRLVSQLAASVMLVFAISVGVYSRERSCSSPAVMATAKSIFTNVSANDQTPSVSPFSGKIFFTSVRDGSEEIYSMDPDGSNQYRVTANVLYDHFPSASADGRVAFAANPRGLAASEIVRQRKGPGSVLVHDVYLGITIGTLSRQFGLNGDRPIPSALFPGPNTRPVFPASV